MFPLLETIKIVDGNLQNIERHQFRFQASYYKLYKKLATIQLHEVIQIPETYHKGIVKLRFLYNQTDCFCQYDFYKEKNIKTLKPVTTNEIDYSLKWVNRKSLETLLKEKQNADDILIIKNQRITDTSFTNIAFYKNGQWHTPRFPLLHGTERARLIDKKIIIPVDILIDELLSYRFFKIFNAMRSFETAEKLPMSNIL